MSKSSSATGDSSVNNSLFDTEVTWAQNSFGLDRRLVKALIRIGYIYPTLVQSKCLPIALQGKDILVRARTGSGKTIAFALPVMQKVLQMKHYQLEEAGNDGTTKGSIKCVILAPTKELVKQIHKCINELSYYCKDFLSVYAVVDDNQKILDFNLQNSPDIIISTPLKLSQQFEKKAINLASVQMLVVDEADLVLSYGYKDDVHKILSQIPKIFQGIFVSATLSAELDKFKRLVLHNPAILKLEESKSSGNLLQFYLEAKEEDKFLVLYVFLKLGLLQGKGLIFVNDVNKCYRLKLFLQQFYITSAVLNAEVPLNSRNHILEEFNRGIFDYLIASDAAVDQGGEDDEDSEDDEDDSSNEEEENSEVESLMSDEDKDEDDHEGSDKEKENDESESKQPQKKSKNKVQGKLVEKDDYGVSRGIDFQGVNFVINFDFPKTASAYIHRIGRTARGMSTGTALSLVTKFDEVNLDNKHNATATRDHQVLQEVREKQPRLDIVEGDHIFAAMGALDNAQREEQRMQPSPLVFNTQELESFRYRVEDTLRAVTGSAVRELRSAEIRREILNSEKLKSYFAENPDDLKVLRHDKAILHPIKQKEHLKHIPEYLIPSSMKSVSNIQVAGGKRKNKRKNAGNDQDRRKRSKQNDPLYAGSNSNEGDNEGEEGGEAPAFEMQDMITAPSGKKEWKMRHKKGEFNPKMNKAHSYQTPGTFLKPKKKFLKKFG